MSSSDLVGLGERHSTTDEVSGARGSSSCVVVSPPKKGSSGWGNGCGERQCSVESPLTRFRFTISYLPGGPGVSTSRDGAAATLEWLRPVEIEMWRSRCAALRLARSVMATSNSARPFITVRLAGTGPATWRDPKRARTWTPRPRRCTSPRLPGRPAAAARSRSLGSNNLSKASRDPDNRAARDQTRSQNTPKPTSSLTNRSSVSGWITVGPSGDDFYSIAIVARMPRPPRQPGTMRALPQTRQRQEDTS